MKRSNVFLTCIIILATFLRFGGLGSNPPSLTWDEAAWGYNAYSLGTDGRDEFGRFLPISYLESFGDFKPVMYAYLSVLPVKLLGLTEFATRFASAFFGVLTVLITYCLVNRLFYSSKYKKWYALLSSLLLALSPWHIMLSRAAFEANVATFFLVCGVWLFIKSIQEKRWFLVLSAISFVFSMYTFNTSRIVAPLLVAFLTLFFWRELATNAKQTIVAGIIGLIILLPSVQFLLSSQARLRFQEVNIFSDISVVKMANQEVANDHNSLLSKVIHNRRILFAQDFFIHYFDNLNPLFLFIKGDGNPKFSIQDVGEMYIWESIFLIVGLLYLFKNHEGNWYIIPVWLLLGIIPAATARETPHALRIETTLPTFQILVAYGITSMYVFFKKYKSLFVIGLSIIAFVNFFYFIYEYSHHYPAQYSGEWQYGYKDSISYVQSVQNNYDDIYITDALGRPYIYYLFYEKIPPQEFRNSAKIARNAFGFVEVQQFNKFHFTNTVGKYVAVGKKRLFINSAGQSLPKNTKLLKTFYLLNGQPILNAYVYENHQ